MMDEEEKILEQFYEKIADQKDLDPEIQRLVDKHFWELIDLPEDEPVP